jgi:prevent-host-death family protein
MTRSIGLYEAKTNLSALVEEAASGNEVVIAKNGRPRARLVAVEELPRTERPFGLYAGQVHFLEDLDAPWPEDIRRALEGENPIEPDDASAPG